MRTQLGRVRALIEGAAGPARVFHAWPADWTRTPCVAYREAENRAVRRADGREALSELTYAVDIWSQSAAEAQDLMENIDAALAGAGFARAQAQTLFEERTRCFHVAARYRVLTDGAALYQ